MQPGRICVLDLAARVLLSLFKLLICRRVESGVVEDVDLRETIQALRIDSPQAFRLR